jgi:biotin carboxylase
MKKNNSSVALIVNGLSTARFYADAFADHDVSCIHIQTSSTPRFKRDFVASKYEINILSEEESRLERILHGRELVCVLPGSDPVVAYADKIAARYNARYRNDSVSSDLRVDKFLMIEAIQKAGLLAPYQWKVELVEQIPLLMTEINSFPVVVKPPRSAGVDMVHICFDEADVHTAIAEILTCSNVYGASNPFALIQEYISGQEFMVDTVSIDGHIEVVSVWEVSRDAGPSPYPLYAKTIGIDTDRSAALIEYTKHALKAVGHIAGPAHTEVKMTSRGPCIIEINSRLHGSLDPSLTEAAFGESQVTRVASLFTANTQLKKIMKDKFCLKTYLCVPHDGVLFEDVDFSDVCRLNSYFSHDANLVSGRELKKTVSLTTAAGYVYFLSGSEDELNEDYLRFRRIETAIWSRYLALNQVDGR